MADARRALRCDELEAFVDSYTKPLTVGRFLRNLRDSFANTSLRYPFSERAAVAELCD